MATAADLKRDFYDQQRYAEAKQRAEALLDGTPDSTDVGALYALIAWAEYQLGNFDTAIAMAQRAPEHGWALLCHLHVRAFKRHDDADLQQVADRLEENNPIGVLNALLIRGRADDTDLQYEQLVHRCHQLRASLEYTGDVDPAVGHVHQNLGRLRNERPATANLLGEALGDFYRSLPFYGTVDHAHHRAGAHYWMAMIQQRRGYPDQAVPLAEAAIDLWHDALRRDPRNTGHRDRLQKTTSLWLLLQEELHD